MKAVGKVIFGDKIQIQLPTKIPEGNYFLLVSTQNLKILKPVLILY